MLKLLRYLLITLVLFTVLSILLWLLYMQPRVVLTPTKAVSVTRTVTQTLTESQSNHSNPINPKRIKFLYGYRNYPWLTTSETAKNFASLSPTLCGGNVCSVDEPGGFVANDADMIVFFGIGLMDNWPVPKKNPRQLFTFYSEESQIRLVTQNAHRWDGAFNYSLTFISNSPSTLAGVSFPALFRKRKTRLTRNFAEERRKYKPASNLTSGYSVDHPSALWFVSNCYKKVLFETVSNRSEYALSLSSYIHIDAFTRKDDCKKPLEKILRKEKAEPKYNDYWFYLAFENSQCKDYITEKYWKIVTQDILTIPIVMGGLTMQDYEKWALPNSYIHVDNFTSPEKLAEHLKYVISNDDAFNYYHQWRNEYEFSRLDLYRNYGQQLCYLCNLTYERPSSIWLNFSTEFSPQNCRNTLKYTPSTPPGPGEISRAMNAMKHNRKGSNKKYMVIFIVAFAPILLLVIFFCIAAFFVQ